MMPDPAMSTPSPLSYPSFDATFGAFNQAAGAEREAAEARKASGEKQKGLQTEAGTELKKARSDVEKTIAQPHLSVPGMEKIPEPPKPEDYRKMSMAFLGAMTLLGAFGGKRIRNAGNASLKAFTGAMNGWQEGNLIAYKQATEQWEQQQKRLLEMNHEKMERYRAVLADRSLSLQEQMFKYKMVASEYEDRIGWEQANAQNVEGVAKHYEMAANATAKATEASNTLFDNITRTDETATARADQLQKFLATPQGQQQFAQWPPEQQLRVKGFLDTYATPVPEAPKFDATAPGEGTGGVPGVEPPPGTVTDTSTTPQPQATPASLASRPPPGSHMSQRSWDMMADYWRATGKLPTGWGEGMSKLKVAIETYANERQAAGVPIDPAARQLASEQASYAGDVSGARSLGTRSVNVRLAANLAASAIPQALKDSEEVNRVKFTPINAAKLNARRLGSDVPMSKWDVSNLQIAELWARALNPQSYTIRQDTFELAIDRLSQIKDKAAYKATLQSIFQAIQREEQGISTTQQQQRGEGASVPDPFADEDSAAKSGITKDDLAAEMKRRGLHP